MVMSFSCTGCAEPSSVRGAETGVHQGAGVHRENTPTQAQNHEICKPIYREPLLHTHTLSVILIHCAWFCHFDLPYLPGV